MDSALKVKPLGLALDPTDEDSDEYKSLYQFAWDNIIAPGAKERTTDTLREGMELGKWPGDVETEQRVQGAKNLGELTGIVTERQKTHQQVLKAREREKELRAQDPNLFQRAAQGLKDLVLPAPPVPVPHTLPLTLSPASRPAPLQGSTGTTLTSTTPRDRLVAETEDVWQQLNQAKNEMDTTLQHVFVAAKGDREVMRHDPTLNRAYQTYRQAEQRYLHALDEAERRHQVRLAPRSFSLK